MLDGVAGILFRLADWPPFLAILGAAALAALFSNAINNWPAALTITAVIAAAPDQSPEVIVGTMIGCTIGANFTVLGSLSTVFWMSLARPRGLHVTPVAYGRAAAIPTAAAVLAACAVAALVV